MSIEPSYDERVWQRVIQKVTLENTALSAAGLIVVLALPTVLFVDCSVSFGQEATQTPAGRVQAGGETPQADEWVIGDASRAGFDEAKLEQLTRDIRAGDTNTHAVLIEHDGSLIYEQYFEGTDGRHGRRLMDRTSLHDLRSATKSVTSALLGIALADKLKDGDFEAAVQRPIGEYLPDLVLGQEQQAITLHHVLTMTAGFEWNQVNHHSYRNPDNDAVRLWHAPNPTQYAFSRPIVTRPGTTWNYNTGCSSAIGDVILKLTGQTIDEFARTKLFAPLGITTFEWYGSDHWEPRIPSPGAGLRLTARDLARIGSVYLHDGKWRGQQVVPAKWVELSTRRHSQDCGKWSGNGIWGYGYHWKVGKVPTGEIILAAAGNGNQRLFVLPKERIAVTIFAGQYNLPFQPHSEMIMKQILQSRR